MRVLMAKHREHWCEDCCEGINRGLSPLFFQTAGFLRSHGLDVNVREFDAQATNIDTDCNVAVFFVSMAGLGKVSGSIRGVKDAGIPTVLILHDSFDAEEEIMRDYDCIDYAVLYPDRELGLYDLLMSLQSGGDLPNSVLARRGDEFLRTKPRPQASDLHHLPSFVPEVEPLFPGKNYTHTYLTVGRGCHYGCGFCDLRRTQNRNRRPEDIADEMAFISRHESMYANEPVSWIHPLFGGNLPWTVAVSDRLIAQKNQVPWRVTTHYQTIERHVVRAWRQAGCAKVSMGLEHLNEPTLKPVNLERFRAAVDVLRQEGIHPMISVIVGIWEDDDESLSKLENYIVSLGPMDVIVTPFLPLRGTPMYESYTKRGILKTMSYKDYGVWGYDNAMLPTKALSPEQVNEWKRRLARLTAVPSVPVETRGPFTFWLDRVRDRFFGAPARQTS